MAVAKRYWPVMKEADPDEINRTNLNVEEAWRRGLHHRDYAAHYFRWSFALRFVKRGAAVLDVGCADGRLCKILYTNMRKPSVYVGVDASRVQVEKVLDIKTNFPKRAILADLREKDCFDGTRLPKFDVVVCFEVLEHFGKRYVNTFLDNVASAMCPKSVLLLSTPNFNGQAAKHHVHEYKEDELRSVLQRHFKIEKEYGTFASKEDVYPTLNKAEQRLYNQLSEYYDSSVMSNIFAPMHPHESRNIMWKMRLP